MSDIAKYSFVPFVRLGLGNQITEMDVLGAMTGATVLERPEVIVSFSVKATGGNLPDHTEPVSRNVKIEGPGDVMGIQPNQVLRVHPAGGVDNFEDNNLVYAEFYEEDFPWRFTPARPSGDRLRPWLALIVLKGKKNDPVDGIDKDTEFERIFQGGTPTPYIRIFKQALRDVFYPQKELHHFAHVHVLEMLDDTITDAVQAAAEIGNIVSRNPDLALSRIMCPRKLEPSTLYHAFLVPAYETGRLAGLGRDTSLVIAQLPSWNSDAPGDADVEMPYYYNWSFQTSEGGDFESLVRKLEVRTFPGNTGRPMNLTAPGLGIKPDGNDAVALVEGALQSVNHTTPQWPSNNAPQLKEQLRNVLNLNENLQQENFVAPEGDFYSPVVADDPIVTPPVYGRWHARVDLLDKDGKDWVHQLNLHPSHRAAAGLGTRVIQEHQEEFMEMAWNQIGPINEANQRIIENEAIKRTADRMFKKNIARMDPFTLVNTLGKAMEVLPMQGELNSVTAKKTLKDSRVPTAFRTGTFTRVANNFTRTALMNRNGNDGAPEILNASLLSRSNANETVTNQTGSEPVTAISAAPKRMDFAIQVDPVELSGAIATIVSAPPLSFLVALTDAIATRGANFQKADVIAALPAEYINSQKGRAMEIMDAVKSRKKTDDLLVIEIDATVYEERINKNYDRGEYDVSATVVINPDKIKTVCYQKYGISAESSTRFSYNDILTSRQAFSDNFRDSFLQKEGEEYKAIAFVKDPKTALDENSFNSSITEGFKPKKNFRRKISSLVEADTEDLTKPLMAYPRFPIPVYDYLKAISPDYIIPNISNIPENTIAVMKPNNVFVESFLAGMNHEFSRELLWREFPTDMRGSYFRHFWEYDNDPEFEMLPAPDQSEADFFKQVIEFQNDKVDVKELDKWNNSLGNNHKRTFGLILLVKGDLFKKYPDTLVYAQEAKFKSGGGYELDVKVQWPVITGKIDPDTYFFGFMQDKAAVRGNGTSDPGYFFVLRERPGQVSFGLDDPEDIIILGQSSAHTANILYQDPILYAKHASLFL